MKFNIQEYDENGNLVKDTTLHIQTRKQALNFCNVLKDYTKHSITLSQYGREGNVTIMEYVPITANIPTTIKEVK